MARGGALYLKVSLCKPVGAAVPVECRRVFRNVCHFQSSETPFATNATNHIYKKARSKCENGPHRTLFSSPVELRLLLPRYTYRTTGEEKRREAPALRYHFGGTHADRNGAYKPILRKARRNTNPSCQFKHTVEVPING